MSSSSPVASERGTTSRWVIVPCTSDIAARTKSSVGHRQRDALTGDGLVDDGHELVADPALLRGPRAACPLVGALALSTVAARRARLWTPARIKPELSL